MRERVGNQFRDQHELFQPWSMNIYDFVTLPHTDPHDIARAVEMVCPDLAVYGRSAGQQKRQLTPNGFEITQLILPNDNDPNKQGWVNGAVWTSTRMDGSIYVAIGTYSQPCIDSNCKAGHGSAMRVNQGRALTKTEQNNIKELIGESDDWPLGAGYDIEVLTGLGFLPLDAPLLGIEVTDHDIYRALDTLLIADGNTWAYKVAQLNYAGFEVVFNNQNPALYEKIITTLVGKCK